VFFETTYRIVNYDVLEAEDHIESVLTTGLPVPIPTPEGMAMMPVPAGVIRFPLTKKAAEEYGQQILDAAAKLPDEINSNLVIANSLQGVDKAADFQKGLRND